MKYLSIVKYVLLIAGAGLTIYGAVSYTDGDVTSEAGISLMLIFSYILMLLTTVFAIGMPLIGIVQNPKSAGKSLIGVALLAAVLGISWALADATPIKVASGDILDNAAELKFSDMALWSTYIMFAGLLVTMVVTEIYKAFK